MWHELIIAVCLVLVIEGVMPFIAPDSWRSMVASIGQLSTGQIRAMGLASMLLGTILLDIVN